MQQTNLKPGDLVRLKAGGPVMAAEVVAYSYARCAWFDERKLPHWQNYMVAALELVAPEDTEPDRPG